MARVLTRPLFRKGGLSQTPRPTHRGGGLTTIRPRYRNGGMNGIMSGIVPRRGYANGPNIPGTPIVPVQALTEQEPWWGQRLYNWVNPTSGDIIQRMQKVQTAPSLVEEMTKPAPIEFRTQAEADAYIAANPEYKGKIKIRSTGQTIDTKLPPSSNVPEIITGTNGAKEDTSQSDLESLQDYMKMFAAASAADPDETRKANWLEVAKIGANILAQPGGDLTGAIGKATSRSLEGISKRIAADKAAKQQAKLLGLKVGAEAMGGGEFGRKINTLARLTGKSKESIAKKFFAGDYDFDKEYLAAAEASGVEVGEARKIYLKNIKTMSDKHPEIAARLNKPFPKKNAAEGEYYVLPGGQFTRWVDGEKLKPTDPGFYDKEI